MQPQEIAKAIALKEGCGCSFSHSVTVLEKFKGQTVWEGIVHVFDLSKHACKRIYAWIDGDKLATVLEKPPVESPATAVRAYIASTLKK